MKQDQHTEDTDDMREEYDFSAMSGGVRGKYSSAFENTTVTVLLQGTSINPCPKS